MDVVNFFLEAARTIPEIQTVLAEDPSPEYARIWVVISAPPFETSYRHRVYAAQLSAQQRDPETCVDFRLVNVQEIKGSIEDVLPPSRRVLFRRNKVA